MIEEKIAFLDMDDTLFDFTGQLRSDLNKIRSPLEPELENIFENTDPWIAERIKLIKSKPNWWRDLPKLELGWSLFNMARSIGFTCHILTKGPKYCSPAWTEKFDCIAHHFDEDVNIDIVGETKHRSYGRVLIDDYPEYILSWLKNRPRGLGIIPENKYNKGHHHPNLIYYNGKNQEDTLNHLHAAFRRKNNEHWNAYL